MQIRQPRTNDFREMERWMDEVSRQLNELSREGVQRHIIIPGQDGEDGEAWIIPGRKGDMGPPGPMGMGIPGQDGEDGENNCLSLRTGAHGSFADDDHTQYQKESEKNNPGGYAGLDASARTVKGVDTTDDVIVNSSAKGLVLKDTQETPHYWRVSVSVLGSLTTTDLGTVKP